MQPMSAHACCAMIEGTHMHGNNGTHNMQSTKQCTYLLHFLSVACEPPAVPPLLLPAPSSKHKLENAFTGQL